MDCPRCHVRLPEVTDPTRRFVTCEGCGGEIDLAEAMLGTGEVTIPPGGTRDPNLGRLLADGRYRIDSFLGAGGMGTVYLGTQLSLGRKVAIKVLAPEFSEDEQFRKRFEREAGALAALDHPNIVAVHDMGMEESTHYIVMSYVAGPDGRPVSLKDLVAAGPVEEDLALRILSQVSGALHYAHGHGIVHRDIKPGNILLDADGNAKLADFGIARVDESAGELTLTMPGMTIGTLKYMAPEQKADAKSADARSDIYSLGVVFYEMLTGEAPEGRFGLPSELRRELDPRLDRIVDRALQRAVENRYQTADEIAREISKITTEREYGKLRTDGARPGGSPATKSPPVPPPLPRPVPARTPETGQKSRGKSVRLALFVLAIIILGTVLWKEGPFAPSGYPAGKNRDRIHALLADGQSIDVSHYREMEKALDGHGPSIGTAGARDAVGTALNAQGRGQLQYVVACVPESLLGPIGTSLGVPRAQVRGAIFQLLQGFPGLMSSRVGDALAVEDDMVLVRYEFQMYGGPPSETVAVAVREGGEWKVLL